MTLKSVSLTVAFAVLATPAFAQFDLPGGLPKIDLGLEKLFKGEAPLTITQKDGMKGLPYLDGWDPGPYKLMAQDARDKNGVFQLAPGSYEFHLMSFCCRGYSYGPTKGMGYMLGPWKGKQKDLVRSVLQRFGASDIPQTDAQELIWAIIARAKPSKMNGGAQRALVALLKKEEIAQLEGYSLDQLNNEVMGRLTGKMNDALRPVYDAENKFRGAIYQANAPYAELEKIMTPEPNEELKSEIPKGRWMLHPSGYYIRFMPERYAKTVVQIVVPRKPSVTRDAMGRITRLESPPGFVSEVTYDDSISPFVLPKDKNVTAYAFKSVRLTMPDPSDATKVLEAVLNKPGYIFRGKAAKKKEFYEAHFEYESCALPQDNFFTRWYERYQRFQEAQEQAEEARREAERLDRILNGGARSDDFFDMEHYRDGVGAAFEGEEASFNWWREHQMRQAEAVAHATEVLNGLPGGEEGGTREFDPSRYPDIPAHGGSQTLGSSGRTW